MVNFLMIKNYFLWLIEINNLVAGSWPYFL